MNAFVGNDICEDELNHGDCMFDGLDCCGPNHLGNSDGVIDCCGGEYDFSGEGLCQGMIKFKKSWATVIWSI